MNIRIMKGSIFSSTSCRGPCKLSAALGRVLEDAVGERFGAVNPQHKACMSVVHVPARRHLVLPHRHPADPCEQCLPAWRTNVAQPAMPFPCSDHVLHTCCGDIMQTFVQRVWLPARTSGKGNTAITLNCGSIKRPLVLGR
jgi:hypothetical protein